MRGYFALILIGLVVVCLAPAQSQAQSLYLLSIDKEAFPDMKATYFAVDKNGTWLQPSVANPELYENGVKQNAVFDACPNESYAVSAGLLVDTHSYIDLARDGVRRLVSFLQDGTDEVGITAMDRLVRVHKDFTGRMSEAAASADTVSAATGVDIQSMFYAPFSGGIPFIAPRLGQKKVLVLITDLHCPNLNVDTARLFADANRYNIAIFSVLLHSSDATGLFGAIARRTGGEVYTSVRTASQIDDIFEKIALRIKHEPCTVRWTSLPPCRSTLNTVELTVPSLALKESGTYQTPATVTANLEFEPALVLFDDAPVGEVRTMDVKVKAPSFSTGDVTFRSTHASITITPSTINLVRGDSTTVVVTYTAVDSLSQSVEIQTDVPIGACNPSLPVVVRYYRSRRPAPTLVVTHPNGGEVFMVGSDTVITWKGLRDQDRVQVHFSADSGRSWTKIADSVGGGQCQWSPLPMQPSDSCLIRVVQDNGGYRTRSTSLGSDRYAPVPTWSPSGKYLAFYSESPSRTKIYDAKSLTMITELESYGRYPIALEWSADEREFFYTHVEWDLNVYNTATWQLDRKLINNWGTGIPIMKSGLNTAGNELAVAFASNLYILNPTSGDTLYSHAVPNSYNGQPQMFWSSDDAYLVVKNSWLYQPDIIHIYDRRSGGPPKELQTKDYGAIALEPMSATIATSVKSMIYLLNATDPNAVDSLSAHQEFVTSLAWSPSGDILASAAYKDGVILWHVPSRSIIRRIKVVQSSAVVSFNFDGSMFLVYGGQDGINFYDGRTGEYLHSYESSAALVRWSPWSNTIIATNSDGTADLIDVPGILQADESDAMFSIVAPETSIRIDSIDMGTIAVGTLRDSIVDAVLCNDGRVPVHITDINPADATQQFVLLGGGGDFILAPGECRELMLQFSPRSAGFHQTELTVRMVHDTLDRAIKVVGVGTAPQLRVETTIVDYGLLEIGRVRDTTVVCVRNIGNQTLTCADVGLRTSFAEAFEIRSGSAPFVLAPNEARELTVRFQPWQQGLHQAAAEFTFTELPNTYFTQFFGTGFGDTLSSAPRSILTCGSERARPGESIAIPVTLTDADLLNAFGVDTISFTVRFDPTLLAPVSGARQLALGAIRVNMSVTSDTISTHMLQFVAGLGSDSSTTLAIDSVVFNGRSSWVESRSGSFALDGLCYEGGVRLLNPTGKVLLGQPSPQPAQSSFSVDVGSIEIGRSTLRLVDVNGVEIRHFLDGQVPKGIHTYTFDLSDVPTGRYHLIYTTPTIVLIKPLAVFR